MTVCIPQTTFKNISHISDDLLLNSLEANLKMFLDWSMLSIGGWFDAIRSNNSLYENQYSKLSLVDDPAFTSGTVWEGLRKDWVWESGIEYCSKSPVPITEAYINGSAVDATNFKINYELGRLIFNDPLDSTDIVEVNHSYRYVQVYRANNADWFNLLQYADPSTKLINRLDNGDWKIGQYHTIQTPSIVIESIPRSRSKPYEIGSTNLVVEQDFGFHILANNKNDRNKLVDILRLQQDLTIWLYDINALNKDNKYPIDYDGTLKHNPLMYPDIISQYPWKKCWLKNINSFEAESVDPHLHMAIVRVTAEIIYS